MPTATPLSDFAKKDAPQSRITVHGGKPRRRRNETPAAEPTGTIVIGLRMTPAEAEWIREYAWQHRTTVGRIVRTWLAELRDRTERPGAPPRQKAATR